MTLYNFNKLSLEGKQKVVWEQGVFLDYYIPMFGKLEYYNCYAIDKFFVEVVYDGEQNVITELRAFKTGHLLDKYSNINF